MIVRHEHPDYLLITQPDHAALAAHIANAWRADGFPQRPTRASVLTAVAEHDWAWGAVDAAPGIWPQTGAPHDVFDAPLEIRQGVWPRTIDQVAAQDPYAAALVAHHALTVYERYRPLPEWQVFFSSLERRRHALHSGPLDDDYAILGAADLLSLICCYGWRQPHRFGHYTAVHGTSGLQITPDPFGGATVDWTVSARRIPARRYASDADLRATLDLAPCVQINGTGVGA